MWNSRGEEGTEKHLGCGEGEKPGAGSGWGDGPHPGWGRLSQQHPSAVSILSRPVT